MQLATQGGMPGLVTGHPGNVANTVHTDWSPGILKKLNSRRCKLWNPGNIENVAGQVPWDSENIENQLRLVTCELATVGKVPRLKTGEIGNIDPNLQLLSLSQVPKPVSHASQSQNLLPR